MSPIGVFCLLTLPWLNPFTFGPTPAVAPWMFSVICLAAVTGVAASTDSLMETGRLRQSWVRAIAGAWLAAALISAVIGMVQYFGMSGALAPWVNGTGLGEAYGNLRQRNQFATLMALGLAATGWWALQGVSWRWMVTPTVLLALGSAASSSRTGLLQWALFIVLAAQWRGQHRTNVRRVLWVAALAYPIAAAVLPWFAGLDPLTSGAWARLRSGDAACMGRLTLWSNVLHLIAQRPWLGWGWGELDYAHFVTLYPGERFCDILDNAHNLPLHLAVELGVPCAAVACAAGLWAVLRARPWREADPVRLLAWSVLALIGLHSLLEYPLWYGPFQVAVVLSLWMLWRTPDPLRSRSSGFMPIRPLALAKIAVLAIFVIAFVGYTAWDYWRISQLYISVNDRAEAYRDNTLDKVRGSWLFRDQVQFAELTTMELTADNAAYVHDLAQRLLHFSPEPRVIEKLISSAIALGRDDEAAFYLIRYQAAFPAAHARWIAASDRSQKAP